MELKPAVLFKYHETNFTKTELTEKHEKTELTAPRKNSFDLLMT